MKKFVCLILCSILLFGAAPYDQSTVITDVSWDETTTNRLAAGSDNWPITWAADNNQYASWGDGYGFAVAGTKQSLGFSRIEGDYNSYAGYDVWGDSTYAENPSQFEGKSYGILSVGGVLYAWWGPGSNTTSYTETRLLKSTDYGATWTKSSWDLADIDDTMIMPTICQNGKDYGGNSDGYVYSYFIRKQGSPSSLDVHIPGYIDLARVLIDDIEDITKYEYFAGFSGYAPTWTSDPSSRVAVFYDSAGVGWNCSVSYNVGTGRYILMTEHTASFDGNMGIFDSANPWGPWTTVAYYTDWRGEDDTFFWNISAKWSNGADFILIYTGINDYDSYNSIKGTIISDVLFNGNFSGSIDMQ